MHEKPKMFRSDSGEVEEFKVSFIPSKSGTYRIEIDSGIEAVGQFSTAIQVLDMASAEDQIEILLQCTGGCVNSTDSFVHAMHKCEAPIHIIATGGCHSAASHILLNADSFELSHGFNACLHGGSDGSVGNVGEYYTKSKFDADFRIRQFKETYEGFLSEQEMDDMIKGQDIWLDADGWMERAERRNEFMKGQLEDMKEELSVGELLALEALTCEQSPKITKKPRKKTLALNT